MDTIFGTPLQLPKIPQPTSQQIQFFHNMYIQELQTLFETNKKRVGQPNAILEIY